jgi:hypothetical protein
MLPESNVKLVEPEKRMKVVGRVKRKAVCGHLLVGWEDRSSSICQIILGDEEEGVGGDMKNVLAGVCSCGFGCCCCGDDEDECNQEDGSQREYKCKLVHVVGVFGS